ncbi:MAG: zinc-dependent metalloprotease family protein [Bacteroidota bacterium]
MKKTLLLLLVFSFGFINAQSDKFWKKHDTSKGKITQNVATTRASFPKQFDLYELNLGELRNALFASLTNKSSQKIIITLPNANGQIEEFEMYEASNFEPELQARFPEIRAYSGKGITDKYATLKLSISPQGIQTMVFRADKANEFMEPYSQDGKTYSIYKSQRNKGSLPFTCSTEDNELMSDVNKQLDNQVVLSNDGKLRTMRLAQSVTAEYSAYYGWTTGTGTIALVVTAVNNTMTRCNGVYEKDLGVHLNLVANTTNVFFNNPATDGYTDGADTNYNAQLQTNLTNIIGEANYDIGHLFSAVGGITGNGNAGCIGCVCTNGSKGSGFTTRSIPQGDDFDIDFVAHEVGHQFGANHTFTMSAERSGNNMEPGSGVTIMGYAGITGQDIDNHSIDTFHATSIRQIQSNLDTKACIVVTNIPNAAPTVVAGADYVVPISTPFILEGSATDPNGTLTYQWEQFDHDSAGQTGTSSDADPAKATGPNWQSWLPASVGYRYMPRLQSIIANAATTSATVNGGDAGILTEALSSVARTLNFRLTVRDNVPYVANTNVGQTNFDDMRVTVVNEAAVGSLFSVTVPSAAGLSYVVGTNQSVTWNVASTNTGSVNTPYVDIYLFTDNTLTNGILLASKVPNDGSETVTIPNNVGTTNRIMIRGNGNIFFDISNNNFAITAPASSFAVAASGEQTKGTCQGVNSVAYTFNYTPLAGFSGTTTFSATGNPAGTTVVFTPVSRTAAGAVTMTVNTTAGTPIGTSNIVANATSGTTKTVPFYLNVAGAPAAATLSTPANNANAQDVSVNLSWAAGANTTGYDIQVATDSGFTNIIATVTSATTNYVVSGLSQSTDYYWRIRPTNASCSGVFGSAFKFTTGIVNCSTVSNNTVQTISGSGKPTVTSTINIPSGVSITDLNLIANITHTYVEDLTITLTSPASTQVIVFDGSCANNDDITATFDDSGSALVCGTTPAVSGAVAPLNPLSAFNGQNSTGTWTLTIKDNASGDGGSLNSWSLNICNIQAALSNPDYEFANLRVFPNPNKGSFAVELNSENSKDIQVSVFDMRGRQIFNRSFANNGAFNQNINLDDAQSGVYLVTISDGTKKTVKRVIVE